MDLLNIAIKIRSFLKRFLFVFLAFLMTPYKPTYELIMKYFFQFFNLALRENVQHAVNPKNCFS